ncbi:MAG TPA: sulfate/thiosulfate ABC transporter permease CysW, partial [Nitrospirota bacterium]|nr:sulfate/thiosulfate ABC transporter permease CysW [Nitrospirota bacterium]
MSPYRALKDRLDWTNGNAPITEPPLIRILLIILMLLFISLFLIIPLLAIFMQAFEKGSLTYLSAISETDTLSAIRLTLIIAAIVLPLNLLFGVVAAWAISKFQFFGKNILITFIDLPFAVSPV